MRVDVDAALTRHDELSRTCLHPDTSLVTTVELSNVREADAVGPTRGGTFSYPGFSGYSPAGVFRGIIERSQRKAGRGQAEGISASARVLVVYMMGTKIFDDLIHPAHMDGAKAAASEIEPHDYGLDAIAFVVRALPLGMAAILSIADDTRLSNTAVKEMFHQAG